MRTAIVGVGNIGSVHFDILQKLGKSVVAVCDIDEHRTERFNDVIKYADYKKMLDEEKIDIVHICTPHYLHAEMIVYALDRNINVLCEKPVCINEEQLKSILEAEKRSTAQLGVCHQNRYNAENVFVKEYLKDKKTLGGHGNVCWYRSAEYYAKDVWRGKWETEGGGVLINQALHTLDLLEWLLGEPSFVAANIENFSLEGEIEVEDTASLICSGGGEFTFFATNANQADLPVNIMLKTDAETIILMHDKVNVNEKIYEFEKSTRVYGKSCYGIGHEKLFEDFYDCVKTGRKFPIDGAEASKVLRLILAAYKSNGKKVRV